MKPDTQPVCIVPMGRGTVVLSGRRVGGYPCTVHGAIRSLGIGLCTVHEAIRRLPTGSCTVHGTTRSGRAGCSTLLMRGLCFHG